MKITNVLSKEQINALFEYRDGYLYWRVNAANVLAGSLAGSPNGKSGHLSVQVEGKLYRVHNLIWMLSNGAIPDGFIVEHKDCNSINNALSNLRLATDSQNTNNQRKRKECTSKYKGVHWNKQSNSWRASIRIDGKVKYIGNFSDEEAAHAAWCTVAEAAHGEFFRPN